MSKNLNQAVDLMNDPLLQERDREEIAIDIMDSLIHILSLCQFCKEPPAKCECHKQAWDYTK